MGIFDRFRHKAHESSEDERGSVGRHQEQDTSAMGDAAQRAALAHDEAADAFSPEIERTRESRESAQRAQEEADRRAAENMTAEGDPWD
ncbi:hypothetical protein [Kitasatospora aureofaciens]|uniref:hypothetical protein n=1 Tax=Kitasatospora aureofaciens TaxID=1894 RepID=UPI001C464ECB|nr:hypothetical protein [Kitasatospora aureofaciens]MBV6698524.1 hypothetical protein [Kitasatospora aureofaciens]